MSCPDGLLLPAELGLQPRWRDLPRLARVECRAFGLFAPPFTPHLAREDRPTGGPVRAAANEVWSWLVVPVGVAVHLGLRAGGCTACLGTTAVLTVTARGEAVNGARQPRTVLLMAGAGLLGVVLVALTVSAGYVVVIEATRHLWAGTLFVSIVGAATAIDVSYRGLRSRGSTPPDLGVETYEVGGLAAWPLGDGHGTALVTALCAGCDILGRPVAALVLTPRKGLETYYQRHGFTPTAGSSYVVRHSTRGGGT